MRSRKGLTLIEIVVVVALMVVLTAVYFLAANPAGQLAGSRNTKRLFDLQTIMNGVRQNIADQANGQFSCASGPVPTSSKTMASAAGTSTYNIGPCLVTTYLYTLPFDPSASGSYYNSVSDYNTGYTVMINGSGTITLVAPSAELGKTVSVTR